MYIEYPNEQTVRFVYDGNSYVNYIEREYIYYDCDKDSEIYRINVFFENGQKSTWISDIVCRYGNALLVDSYGRYIIGCSLRGIYCCDLKTGKLVWRKKKMAKRIIMNEDDTLTCEWHKQLFVIDLSGNVLREVNTHYDVAIFYLGENKFMMRNCKSTWIILSSMLDVLYTIPHQIISSGAGIRSADIDKDDLSIKFWVKDETMADQNNERRINLAQYVNRRQ